MASCADPCGTWDTDTTYTYNPNESILDACLSPGGGIGNLMLQVSAVWHIALQIKSHVILRGFTFRKYFDIRPEVQHKVTLRNMSGPACAKEPLPEKQLSSLYYAPNMTKTNRSLKVGPPEGVRFNMRNQLELLLPFESSQTLRTLCHNTVYENLPSRIFQNLPSFTVLGIHIRFGDHILIPSHNVSSNLGKHWHSHRPHDVRLSSSFRTKAWLSKRISDMVRRKCTRVKCITILASDSTAMVNMLREKLDWIPQISTNGSARHSAQQMMDEAGMAKVALDWIMLASSTQILHTHSTFPYSASLVRHPHGCKRYSIRIT